MCLSLKIFFENINIDFKGRWQTKFPHFPFLDAIASPSSVGAVSQSVSESATLSRLW